MMCKQCLGLQRKIKAMEEFIESKGFVLNSEDEENIPSNEVYTYESMHSAFDLRYGMGELFDREREVKG